jgi:purine-binding chemotaxis protein CheW
MRLGLAAVTGDSRNVIIVVNLGSQLAGLLVHAVSDILTLESGNLQPPPEVGTYVQQKFVRALAVVENRMIRLLNLPAVLPDISAEVA